MNKVKYIITKKQARQFLLIHQKLLEPYGLENKNDIIEFMNNIGCIQYDPLDKVGQNHHLFFQARVKNYKPEMLDELLYDERKLIDGWDKNKSIYPITDRPYFKVYRDRAHKKYIKNANPQVKKILPVVREEIKKRGPLSSTDLKFNKKIDWSWSPARISKVVLESLYNIGELIIHHRKGTKKIYGLTKKHLPKEIINQEINFDTRQDYYNWHILRRTGSIGMIRNLSEDTWLGIKGLKKSHRDTAIEYHLENNNLIPIKIKGNKRTYYIRQKEEEVLNKIIEGINYNNKVSFIAPLDNLIWNRNFIEEIFEFDYRWEVYKPVSERKYGYYVLPVLYGDKFIGRFEPEYNKTNKILIIKNWWWEEDIKNIESEKINKALLKFKNYLGAKKIINKEGNIILNT